MKILHVLVIPTVSVWTDFSFIWLNQNWNKLDTTEKKDEFVWKIRTNEGHQGKRDEFVGQQKKRWNKRETTGKEMDKQE